MNWPAVTILIVAYKRPVETRAVINALQQNISYPNLKWMICDDSTGIDYQQALQAEYPHIKLISTAQNSGWGANVNNALRRIDTPYVYIVENDYVLKQPLDLRIGIALMEVNRGIGRIRYDGIVGHQVICHLRESDIAKYLPDYRQGVALPGKLSYWLLDSASPTLWLYSNRPALSHMGFYEFYGMYPEGLKLGATEESYSHTVKDMMTLPSAPAIAALPEWVVRWYDDIGVSFQHSEEDRGK